VGACVFCILSKHEAPYCRLRRGRVFYEVRSRDWAVPIDTKLVLRHWDRWTENDQRTSIELLPSSRCVWLGGKVSRSDFAKTLRVAQ
jgi:hypothetical protein